jgi:hypothetical protein
LAAEKSFTDYMEKDDGILKVQCNKKSC